jgi:hypothetical protein
VDDTCRVFPRPRLGSRLPLGFGLG